MAEVEVLEGEVVPETTALAIPVPDEPMSLVRLAIERNVDVEVLERLVALQEHVLERNAKSAFIAALARFQEECPILIKSGNVDFGSKGGRVNYQFAPLEDIVHAIRPVLGRNGLSFSHDSEMLEGNIRVICTIRHIDGHSEQATFTCPMAGITSSGMNSAQQAGSAITYGRRYSLIQALGLVTEADTDAHVPQSPAPQVVEPPASRKKWQKTIPTPPVPRVSAEQSTKWADDARALILNAQSAEIIGRAIVTLGNLYKHPEDQIKLAVRKAGAYKEARLTVEQALEAVNMLQAWYEGDRKMEDEPAADWQPEPPPEEAYYNEPEQPPEYPEESPASDEKPSCPNPNCKLGTRAVIKGKAEYGGGWVCWKNHKKTPGCGHKWGGEKP